MDLTKQNWNENACSVGQNDWMGFKKSGGIQEPHVGTSFTEVNPLFLACRQGNKHAIIYTDDRKESPSLILQTNLG